MLEQAAGLGYFRWLSVKIGSSERVKSLHYTCMKRLILREPTYDDKDVVWDFREEFLFESDHIPGSAALGKHVSYEEWLEAVRDGKDGKPERDIVPSTQYLAFERSSGKLVGCIQLRHNLNQYLEDFGGHIGYSVRPSERRKGYAYEMVLTCMEQAAAKGMSKALITCDETNIASEAVIRKAGGVYEDTRGKPSIGQKKRFWLATKK